MPRGSHKPASLEGRRPRIDAARARHLDIATEVAADDGTTPRSVTVNGSESPLAWLARRKGRDGRALIEPLQLLAGERLRMDFTRAGMMPRMTASWTGVPSEGRRAGGLSDHSDLVTDARLRVRAAMNAVGPELSGLLMDVCCFLKTLQDVERERGWPARSAKVVLQIGLDRLAAHYGLNATLHGPAHAPMRRWQADKTDPGDLPE